MATLDVLVLLIHKKPEDGKLVQDEIFMLCER